MGLGQAYLELGQFQSAEASYLTALNMAPELKPALDGLLKIGENDQKFKQRKAVHRDLDLR